MLSGVMAETSVAADAGTDKAAAAVMAALKIVFLNCMTDLPVLVDACVTRPAACPFP
jgi:hypothetical protein